MEVFSISNVVLYGSFVTIAARGERRAHQVPYTVVRGLWDNKSYTLWTFRLERICQDNSNFGALYTYTMYEYRAFFTLVVLALGSPKIIKNKTYLLLFRVYISIMNVVIRVDTRVPMQISYDYVWDLSFIWKTYLIRIVGT